MFKFANNRVITMTRGDSGNFSIDLNIGDKLNPEYLDIHAPLESGESGNVYYIYFGVTEPRQMFEDSIILKSFSWVDVKDNKINIKIEPLDTEYLLPGVYYYQVKIEEENAFLETKNVYTVVDKTKFIVVE